MAGDVVPFEVPAGLLDKYQDLLSAGENDLSAGVADSFGVISFKGKVWRVKFKGEERIVKTPDGDPAPSLFAVIVKGSPQISKIYYPGSYTEGDNDAPTCFSVDGVRPDPGAEAPQSPTCAACPKNVWGSKVTEQGNKTKACADSRRLAVVPYPDMKNEAFGGPLLLRIPPASLQDLKSYQELLKRNNAPYQLVVTKISFDMDVAYPKLTFTAMRALTEEEAAVSIAWGEDEIIDRMLAEAPIADGMPEAGGEPAGEPTLSQRAAAPKPASPAPKAKPAAPKPTPEPVAEEIPETAPLDATPEPEPEPEKEEKKAKPTPKEQNAVEANEVDANLDQLLGNMI